MSRVDDSDNQRIKDMQEQELRTRMDREKRDQEVRVTKSFQEVMKERAIKQTNQKQAATNEKKGQTAAQAKDKQAVKNLLSKGSKNTSELSKKAALSSSLASKMAKARTADAQNATRAEADRTEDLSRRADDDKERIDKDLREASDNDALRAEDKEAAFKQVERESRDAEGRAAERTDRDGHRRGGSEGQTGEDDRRAAQQIRGVEASATQQPQAPRISQELIDKIVSAIQTAHLADGRTEMQVELKGTMLEGVKLKVSAKNGKVSCVFEGCDRETKNLLEASKGALMRGLSKRGMTLVSLKVA